MGSIRASAFPKTNTRMTSTSLPSLVNHHHAPPQPPPSLPSHLPLPDSLWLQIAQSFPPSSQTSPSLICHWLLNLLLHSASHLMHQSPVTERLKLLNLLDSTLPKHLLCYACCKYHPRAGKVHCITRAAVIPRFLHVLHRRPATSARPSTCARYGQELRLPTKSQRIRPPKDFSYAFRSRTVDGHLLLCITSTDLHRHQTH